ncbi:MAG: metallophosphoesterase, partial [Pyrinomonadaceae bacterium]
MNRIFASVLIVASLIFATLGNVTYAQAPAKGAKVASSLPAAVKLTLPVKEGSVRFAAIGDTGTGTDKQHQVADMMLRYRSAFPFDFVVMMGDNLYGGETANDFRTKFSDVYKPLLDINVKFYAAL